MAARAPKVQKVMVQPIVSLFQSFNQTFLQAHVCCRSSLLTELNFQITADPVES